MKNGTVQSWVKINEGEQYIVNIVPLGQPCFAMGSPVFLAQILRAFFTVSHGSVDMTFFLARSAANEGNCNWELWDLVITFGWWVLLTQFNVSELHFAKFLGIPHLTIFCAPYIAKGKGGVEWVFLWACLLSISKWFQSRRTDLI